MWVELKASYMLSKYSKVDLQHTFPYLIDSKALEQGRNMTLAVPPAVCREMHMGSSVPCASRVSTTNHSVGHPERPHQF